MHFYYLNLWSAPETGECRTRVCRVMFRQGAPINFSGEGKGNKDQTN